MELIDQVHQLIENQVQNWDLAAENYKGLEQVKLKPLQYKNFKLLVQYNPKRIISSSAKIDNESIAKRPCFLCEGNLPIQQEKLVFKENYLILVNPFPIFKEHLTIPLINHEPQLINGRFADMLDLTKELKNFTVLYNGPLSGASAPDHFHFQACSGNVLPIVKDFEIQQLCAPIAKHQKVRIFQWLGYLRGTITIESTEKDSMVTIFNEIYMQLKKIQPEKQEPMMNLLAYISNNKWVVHIFPRKQHRPYQYFEKGNSQILLSPGAIDLGGVLITPREEDFLKLTLEVAADILRQVCFDEEAIKQSVKSIFL